VPIAWDQVFDEDYRGRVRFDRSFGCPSGLEEGQQVEVVVREIWEYARVVVNGCALGEVEGTQGGARFEITQLLKSRNLLQIDVESPRWRTTLGTANHEISPTATGRLGEVVLEIVSPPSRDATGA
jgi:hypothetical protein